MYDLHETFRSSEIFIARISRDHGVSAPPMWDRTIHEVEGHPFHELQWENMGKYSADLVRRLGFHCYLMFEPSNRALPSLRTATAPCRYSLLGRSSAQLECTTFVQWQDMPGQGVPPCPVVFPSISSGETIKLFAKTL